MCNFDIKKRKKKINGCVMVVLTCGQCNGAKFDFIQIAADSPLLDHWVAHCLIKLGIP